MVWFDCSILSVLRVGQFSMDWWYVAHGTGGMCLTCPIQPRSFQSWNRQEIIYANVKFRPGHKTRKGFDVEIKGLICTQWRNWFVEPQQGVLETTLSNELAHSLCVKWPYAWVAGASSTHCRQKNSGLTELCLQSAVSLLYLHGKDKGTWLQQHSHFKQWEFYDIL